MNTISFSGRLGKDAELKTIGAAATSVLNFSIADDIGWGDKKTTQWFNCAVFGTRAESLAQYLKKGLSVTVSGEFKARTYDKSDGSKATSLEITVDRLAMQSKAEQSQTQGAGVDHDDLIPF